ncbi:MAG: hypothetical protein V4640_08510 [Verrucomicrobiota bacterium]
MQEYWQRLSHHARSHISTNVAAIIGRREWRAERTATDDRRYVERIFVTNPAHCF